MNAIHTDNAPAAIGPYSQAIEVNGFVFASGQIPIDPATGIREMYALARELSECQNLTDWIIKSQTENEGAQVSMACTQN